MDDSGPAVPSPRRRIIWACGIGTLVVVLAAGGFFAWRAATDQLGPATVAAQRAAEALVDHTIGDGAFGATVGPAEVDDLTATVRGMGVLRPVITVQNVQLDEQNSRGTARLQADWTIHEGKPHWVQDAYLQLVRGSDGWSAVWSRDLIASGLQPGDRLRAVRLAPVRGEITGDDDERLVWNADAKRIGLDKTQVAPDQQPAAARALAKAVGIDPEDFAATVARYGPKAYVEAAVVRAVGSDEWGILAKARAVPGTLIIDAVRPLAVSSSFARALLGSVGQATGEIIKASSGTIREGDLVGLGGLQKTRNATLMGLTGFVVQAYPDGHPEAPRELFRVPAANGEALRITVSAGLQKRAESLIGTGERRAVVAVRPSDAALLVLASSPGTTTATSRHIYPEAFAPVDVVAGLRADGLPAAVAALGLTGDAGIDVPVFLSATDGGTLRLSAFSLAAATASVGAGLSIRPQLFVDEQPPAIADGLRPDEVEEIRRQMRASVVTGELHALADLPAGPVLAAGDGRLWAVALYGDLAVAVYDSDGRSAALLEKFLRSAG
ncbi:hypothetical protein [Micropruina sp.]|uniref:hypothetical protein n=1 Tax=Micropruina sp. TaxID=2737536 RepID=UPI0039E5174B